MYANGFDGRTDVVDPEDMPASLQGNSVEGGSAIQGFFGCRTEEFIDHGLTREAYQEGVVGEEADEVGEMMQEQIVLLQGLAETEAGIKDDISDAKGMKAGKVVGKETGDRGEEGRLGESIGGSHGSEVNGIVGQDVREVQVGNGGVHRRIVLPRRDVVDDMDAIVNGAMTGHLSTEGVDADDEAGVVVAQWGECRQGKVQTPHFLVNRDGREAWTRAACPDVEDSGTLLNHGCCTTKEHRGLFRSAAPGIEGVGRYIDDAHNLWFVETYEASCDVERQHIDVRFDYLLLVNDHVVSDEQSALRRKDIKKFRV